MMIDALRDTKKRIKELADCKKKEIANTYILETIEGSFMAIVSVKKGDPVSSLFKAAAHALIFTRKF